MSLSSGFLTDKKVVFTLSLLSCLLWGSAFPAVKAGYAIFNISAGDTASQILFAGYRFFLAGLLLVLFCLAGKRKIFSLDGQDVIRAGSLGFLMTTMQYIFFYIGVANVSGVKGSIITGVGTFFAVGLAHLFFKNEALTRRTIYGCLIGFAGVISVNFSDSLDLSFRLGAEGMLVIAAFLHALGGVYGKIISRVMDTVVMTALQLTIGGFILILLGFVLGGSISGFTPKSIALLAYLSLISSTAFAVTATLLKHNPVSMVTVFQFSIPVFGAVLSAFVLNESLLDWKNLVALVCVCCGIYLVTQGKRTK